MREHAGALSLASRFVGDPRSVEGLQLRERDGVQGLPVRGGKMDACDRRAQGEGDRRQQDGSPGSLFCLFLVCVRVGSPRYTRLGNGAASPSVQCLFPARCTETPHAAVLEDRPQIVPPLRTEREELIVDARGHSMAGKVQWASMAVPVAEEACQGLARALSQRAAQHVDRLGASVPVLAHRVWLEVAEV